MKCDLLLRQISLRYQRILGADLVGISVHGSLAFGCFHWQSSDVDFLVVTCRDPAQAQKEAMIRTLLELIPPGYLRCGGGSTCKSHLLCSESVSGIGLSAGWAGLL